MEALKGFSVILIPPKSNATTQGEHVFFDIDVKGGEKVWCGCYSWRIAQPFRVYINAKGGYCWHVYRKSVLVIDGKIRVCIDGKTGTNIKLQVKKKTLCRDQSLGEIAVSKSADEFQFIKTRRRIKGQGL